MKIGPIESDVPVPPVIRHNKYRFDRLEAGQSFAFEGDGKQFITAAHNFAKRHGWQITVRKVGNGYRCWRIA